MSAPVVTSVISVHLSLAGTSGLSHDGASQHMFCLPTDSILCPGSLIHTNPMMRCTCIALKKTQCVIVLLTLQMTRRQLVKEVEDEEELQAGGAVDFTGKNKTGGAHQVPSIELRRDAPKMELRLEEEAQLPLV